eukprot:4324754-Pleurochrysis_carterae.AAC.1
MRRAHRDPVLPDEHLLVVGRGGEAAVLLAKGDGVHRAEVLVVHLFHLAGVGVVLHLRGRARARERERESRRSASWTPRRSVAWTPRRLAAWTRATRETEAAAVPSRHSNARSTGERTKRARRVGQISLAKWSSQTRTA